LRITKKHKIFIISVISIFSIITLIFSFISLLNPPTNVDITLTLRVGAYENKPKIYTDDDGNVVGFFPELFEYIASKEGWEIEYIHGTWAQCLDRLENNEIDIMVDVAYTKERVEKYDFTNVDVLTNWGIVYRKLGSRIETLSDLSGKKVAVMARSIHTDGEIGIKNITKKMSINCTFIELVDYSQVFEMVSDGGADAGVVNRLFGLFNEDEYDIEETSIIFNPMGLRFAFPKNATMNQNLITTIDQHLLDLMGHSDSKYYNLLESYVFFEVEEFKIPEWVLNAIITSIGLIALFFSTSAILRRQVKSRTADLQEAIIELEESEEKYRGIFENIIDVYYRSDLEGNLALISPSGVKLLGYDNYEEIIGKNVAREFYSRSEDREPLLKLLEKHGNVINYQVTLKRKDRTLVEVETSSHFIYDQTGKPIAVEGIIRDITDRKQVEKSLLESEERYHGLFEDSPISLWEEDFSGLKTYLDTLRQSGIKDFRTYFNKHPEEVVKCINLTKIIEVNRTTLKLYKARNKEELLENLDKLFREGSLETFREEFIALAEGKTKYRADAVTQTLMGDTIYYILGLSVIPGYEETLSRVLISIEDITERKEAEEALLKARNSLAEKVEERTKELQQANIELRELDHLKSMFLASMSHELRTPLNSVIGFTGWLLMGMEGDLNEEQTKQLKMVKSNAIHLLDLINDILDISKIEAGKVDLAIEKFEIAEVVNEVVTSVLPLAQDKGLNLISNVPEGVILTSDKRRIKQIIMNLTSNAIKFTDQGDVKIEVRSLNNKDLEFIVSDSGIGIKKEDLEKLFQPFHQIDMSSTKRHEGTGLGLYLCKKLLDLLHGDISVTSHFGEGSEFKFIIPINFKEEI